MAMGHIPLDLIATGVLDGEFSDALEPHFSRSDYLVLVVGRDGGEEPPEALEPVVRAYEYALENRVPVLGLVAEETGASGETASETDGTPRSGFGQLIDRLRANTAGMSESLEAVDDSAVWILLRMFEKYQRPGWVSSSELPAGDVATELVRLFKENAELRGQVGSPEDEPAERERFDNVSRTLEENKILIPLWDRASNKWDKPFELNLHDFFVRLAPEMVVEMASSEGAQFIPTGVCELDPGDTKSWIVPLHSLNLWLTDLMALSLVAPSTIKHSAKDVNQYWTLTEPGRDFIARVRRSVLDTGGHRHVGFTSEFRVVRPEDVEA